MEDEGADYPPALEVRSAPAEPFRGRELPPFRTLAQRVEMPSNFTGSVKPAVRVSRTTSLSASGIFGTRRHR
jgi:hypothetical protein